MSVSDYTFEQLETAFRHGNFKPVYFFYGDEQFLIDELQSLAVSRAIAPHERDFNLNIVYGAETDAPAVLALCASYPVMAERRLVIVRDFERLSQNARFVSYAEHPNPSCTLLLLCSGKPNLSANPYRALKAKSEWAEFKPLYERQLPGWLQKRVQARGRQIKPDAVQMLADLVGTNLQRAAVEIEKLLTYIGERTIISKEDVLDASGLAREFNVFELQRAIGTGKYARALLITERMLQQTSNRRGEALMIVSMLSAYFMKLWKLTVCKQRRMAEKEMASYIGVSPFFINEYVSSLNRFTLQGLENAFAALLAADFEIKGGSTREERLILTLLLARLVPERA